MLCTQIGLFCLWFPKVTQCLNVALKLDILWQSQVLFFFNFWVPLNFFAPNQLTGPCDQSNSLTWVSSPSPKGLHFLQNLEIISRKIGIRRRNFCICRILSMSIPLRFLSKPVLFYESVQVLKGMAHWASFNFSFLAEKRHSSSLKRNWFCESKYYYVTLHVLLRQEQPPSGERDPQHIVKSR